MKSLYEELNGSYIEVGEVKVPALISTDTNYEIGFWGQSHKEYLEKNHKVIYYNLLTSDKLNSYLHDVDIRTKKMYDYLNHQLAEEESITEQFKSEDQMLWVQQMNNNANQARKTVYNIINTY